MESTKQFGEVLETADKLTLDEQETLVDILHRRILDRRRAELVKDARETQEEFRAGGCRATGADDLMREITS